MRLSGKEKATIFLSMLGSETSSAILRYLPEDLADAIASSINHLPTPTPDALGQVFSDFKSYVSLPPPQRQKKEEEFIPSPPPEKEDDLGSEERILMAESKKLAFLLSDERPQIAAFMLYGMPPMKREEVLMSISQGRDQIDAIMNNMKSTPMSQKLRQRLTDYFAEKV